MKNELGIEVCCENCSFYNMGCKRKIENYCKERAFVPSRNVYEARIKELQEQQFTEKELNHLQVALILAKDEFNFTPADNLLKKTEQTLKNLEGNLNNEQ